MVRALIVLEVAMSLKQFNDYLRSNAEGNPWRTAKQLASDRLAMEMAVWLAPAPSMGKAPNTVKHCPCRTAKGVTRGSRCKWF